MKKIICFALCAILVFGMLVPVSAATVDNKTIRTKINEAMALYQKGDIDAAYVLCKELKTRDLNKDQLRSCNDIIDLCIYSEINRALSLCQSGDIKGALALCNSLKSQNLNVDQIRSCNDIIDLCIYSEINRALSLYQSGDIDGTYALCEELKTWDLNKDQMRACNDILDLRAVDIQSEINKALALYQKGDIDAAYVLCKELKTWDLNKDQLRSCNDIIDLCTYSEINRALSLCQSGDIKGALALCNSLKSQNLNVDQIRSCNDIIDLCIYSEINRALSLYQSGDIDGAYALCEELKTWDLNKDQMRACNDILDLRAVDIQSEINKALALYQKDDITNALKLCETITAQNLNEDQLRSCNDIIDLCTVKIQEKINNALALYQKGDLRGALDLCETIKSWPLNADQLRSCDDIIALCYASVQEKLNTPTTAFAVDTTDYGSIYKQFIDSKGGKNWKFSAYSAFGYETITVHFIDAYLLDFEADGIPELVTIFSDDITSTLLHIYKYKNGKIEKQEDSTFTKGGTGMSVQSYIVKYGSKYYLYESTYSADYDRNTREVESMFFDHNSASWKKFTSAGPRRGDGPYKFYDSNKNFLGLTSSSDEVLNVSPVKEINAIMNATKIIDLSEFMYMQTPYYGSQMFKHFASDYANQTKALIDKAVAENNLSAREQILKRVKILENNGYGYLISSYAKKLDNMSLMHPAFLHLLNTDKLKETFPSHVDKYIADTKKQIQLATSAGNGALNIPMLIQKAFTVYRAGYDDDAVTLCNSIKQIPGINESQIAELNAIIEVCTSNKILWIYDEINRALALYQQGKYDDAVNLCNTIKSWTLNDDQKRSCDDIIKLVNEEKRKSEQLAIYDEINRALALYKKGDHAGAIKLCNTIKSRNINEDQKRSCDDILALCYAEIQKQINAALKQYQNGNRIDAIKACEKIKLLPLTSDLKRSCNDILILAISELAEIISYRQSNDNDLSAYELYKEVYAASPSLTNDSDPLFKNMNSHLKGIYNEMYITIYAKSGLQKLIKPAEYYDYINTGVWFGYRYISDATMKNTAYNSVKNHIRSRLYVQGSGQFPDVSSVSFSKVNDTRYVMRGTYSALNRLGIRVQGSYTAYINYTPYGISSVEINAD